MYAYLTAKRRQILLINGRNMLVYDTCRLQQTANYIVQVGSNGALVSVNITQVSLFTVSFQLWKWHAILVKSLQSADHRQQTLFHMLLASFCLIEADMFSLHYYATM